MGLKEAIKSLRIETGLSQREIAEKFGVDKRTIARWEVGSSYPKQSVADRILHAVNLMDISEQCRTSVIEALQEGRRQGTSAKGFGFEDVDQELLCKIVDESVNAVYVIEVGTYELLYANKKTESLLLEDGQRIKGEKCYKCFRKKTSPCKECPLKHILGYEFVEQDIKYFDGDKYFRIRGKRTKWNGKEVFMTYVSDITEIVRDKRALES